MNIVDYASLQTAVADWLNRADLATRIPDFIGLAEAWMMRKVRPRLLEAEAALNGVVGSRVMPLPADYREPLNLWWQNGVDRLPLRFIPADLLDVGVQPNMPLFWTIDGANIAFERPCDAAYAYTFRYRQTLALSTGTPTNVILTDSPDLYLFAALAEASLYLKDPQAASVWQGKRDQALQDFNEREGRQRALTTLSVDAGLYSHRRRGGFNVYRGY